MRMGRTRRGETMSQPVRSASGPAVRGWRVTAFALAALLLLAIVAAAGAGQPRTQAQVVGPGAPVADTPTPTPSAAARRATPTPTTASRTPTPTSLVIGAAPPPPPSASPPRPVATGIVVGVSAGAQPPTAVQGVRPIAQSPRPVAAPARVALPSTGAGGAAVPAGSAPTVVALLAVLVGVLLLGVAPLAGRARRP